MTTINQNNFHLSTYGRFQVVEQPSRTPDYISYTTWGEISSIYYYENNGVRHNDIYKIAYNKNTKKVLDL